MSRQIDVSLLTDAIAEMCVEANLRLSKDMAAAMANAIQSEESPLGKKVLSQLEEHLKIADAESIPICQDTGMAVIFLEIGQEVQLVGGDLTEAVNAGVNEKANAVICYTVAGLLFGAAGAISVCSTNGVTPTINFSTIASMFACFLPLFFSQFINQFCNKQIAVLMVCVAYEFIQIGFGQISSVKAFFTSDVYKVVEAAVLVLFLIYLNNEDLILRKRKNYA